MIFELCLLTCALHFGSKLFAQKNDKMSLTIEPNEPNIKTQQYVVKELTEITDNQREYENEIDEGFTLSVMSTGLAAAGSLFLPPFSILSLFGIIYPCKTIFNKAYDATFNEKKITIELLDSICVVVEVINGYFVVSAMTNVIYFGAQKMRLKTEKQTRQGLIDIFGKQPKMIWVLKDGVEIQIPFESMNAGDITIVNSGEPIPADGTIIHGIASIDQHVLTGESKPAEKGVGDTVFATSLVLSGYIHVLVEKSGNDTIASKICEIINNTADYTASIENIGQEMANASVLPTLTTSIAAFPFVGERGTGALLCSNFLDNMRIGAPTSMINFLHIASQHSILIKDGRSFQLLQDIDIVVFDKTGTLTLKQPYIKKIYTVNGLDENDILCKAAAAEYRQTHPIATAILDEANKRQIIIPDISQATYQVGYGITVQLGDQHIRVGSKSFMEMENIIIPDYIQSVMSTGHEKGHSFIFIASNNYLSGAIELAPQIRHEAQQVIQQFKQYQISLCIISGDDETPTRKLAKKLGIDRYYAGVLPEQKADLVKQLQDQGKKVCFVGDGINDSIALKTANVSVSIQGASMVALDSAQIVLMDNSLKNLPEIFRLAHDFKNNLKKSYVTVSSLSAMAVGGVFLFNFEIPTVTILSSVSLCSCLIMSLLPGVKENKQSS